MSSSTTFDFDKSSAGTMSRVRRVDELVVGVVIIDEISEQVGLGSAVERQSGLIKAAAERGLRRACAPARILQEREEPDEAGAAFSEPDANPTNCVSDSGARDRASIEWRPVAAFRIGHADVDVEMWVLGPAIIVIDLAILIGHGLAAPALRDS